MSLSLRPARPGDAALVLQLIRELAAYERLPHEVDATGAAIDAALFGAAPRVFCDIAEWQDPAERQDAPAGLAIWFYSFSTFRGRHGIYLEDLFVRPDFRGRGIGRALLSALAQRCVTEDLPRLEWSVLDWNEPALSFYRALGATPMDGWTIERLTGEALARLGAQR